MRSMAAYVLAGLSAGALPRAPRPRAARFAPVFRPRAPGALVLGLCLWACLPATAAEPQAAPAVFERDVLPILTAHCLKCHGLEARKASLDLRTASLIRRGGDSGPAISAGAPDDSPLYKRIADRSMPPKG